MVWIKRNLIFVLSAAVGVLLMGGAGYFLYSGLNANTTSSEELQAAVAELESYRTKPVIPSRENIKQAKEQQELLKGLLKDVKNSFASFPKPEKTDEKGFKSLLNLSITQLQQSATNAGVGLPLDYAFTFSSIKQQLSFPVANIEPWSIQLQEIKAICGILFDSKINYLESLKRTRSTLDDLPGPDYLPSAPVTNTLCVRTPYEITFRAFSGELASVLEGFQKATNCYYVKNIDVLPASATTMSTGSYGQPGYGETSMAARMAMYRQQQPQAAAQAPVYGAPVVFLSEKPLRVTLLIDLIKLNTP